MRYLLFLVLVILVACDQHSQQIKNHQTDIFRDELIRKIYDFQDRRESDSLQAYFSNPNPTYREQAVLALGSVQDSAFINPLMSVLMNDQDIQVRRAAAYALGQTFDSTASKVLFQALDIEDSLLVRKEILEGIGKCVTQKDLPMLNRLEVTSRLEKEGLAWGIYRAALRNVYDDVSEMRALQFIDSTNSYQTRLAAANYFFRTQHVSIDENLSKLIAIHSLEKSPYVRMALIAVFRHSEKEEAKKYLKKVVASEADYRERVNAIRALKELKEESVISFLLSVCSDSNYAIAVAAAEAIQKKLIETHFEKLWDSYNQAKHPRVKALLLIEIFRNDLGDEEFLEEIKRNYFAEKSEFNKAFILGAFGGRIKDYEFVVTELHRANHKAISTAAISSLIEMRKSKKFPKQLEEEFAEIFKGALMTADLGIIYLLSEVLMNPEYGYKEIYKDFQFLYEIKGKLSLPKDNEGLQVLEKTIAYFEEKESEPVINEFNNPISWEVLQGVNENTRYTISTTKGDIILRFYPGESPGSVANFIRLAEQGYYNGIAFHRVVPNFVVQGGCNRGDGFGGEDFSIRSELGRLRYEEGSVGMASAGKDTEGTQWFISHSPTPHLDGRYTIFAQVTEGMEVVHKMEVGDIILGIERLTKEE